MTINERDKRKGTERKGKREREIERGREREREREREGGRGWREEGRKGGRGEGGELKRMRECLFCVNDLAVVFGWDDFETALGCAVVRLLAYA